MIHYIEIGGRERPITFSYSVPFQYQLKTGRFYNVDITTLCINLLQAGNALIEQVGEPPATLSARLEQIRAANSHPIDMLLLLDVALVCLEVGHRKAGVPIDFTKDDVADWLGEDREAIFTITQLLLAANFNLKPDEATEDPASSEATTDEGKKKTPARLTGTRS